MTTLGSIIRELRHEQGLTQEQLGERAGVERVTVLHTELGHTRSLPTIERLLDALGYELEVVKK